MGLELEFSAGDGPVIHNPLRRPSDVERFRELESVEPLEFVIETVRLTRAGLPADIPVIGFAGAPFTLASYAIEGGGSRNYVHSQDADVSRPGRVGRDDGPARACDHSLSERPDRRRRPGRATVRQLGRLPGSRGLSPLRAAVHAKPRSTASRRGVPVIHFATGNPALLPLLAEAGGDVIGIDWRIDLDDAWRVVGHDRAVQGNLDPVVLLAEPAEIRRRATTYSTGPAAGPGHIFNLGHGILPQTPVENVLRLIDAVRQYSPE